MKRILHIDMDAFFASVEQVRDPTLLGKPLIIGGNRDDLRGVVCTASYEARKYGVHSAMPLAQAIKLCPNGIFMRGNHALYREESRKIRAILERVSPILQMASIDEAYIDVTGSLELFGGDEGIGRFIKEEIKKETGLPCTVAISSNKLVSKIASDYAKPDGFISIQAGEEKAFLAPLPVRKMPGAGPRCCETLSKMGIKTIGELAAAPMQSLERRFGVQSALRLQRAAQGISNSTVEPYSEPKSISRETTFQEDSRDWGQLEKILAQLLERCMYSLREHGLEARSFTLKVRYKGFDTKTFAKTLSEGSCIDRDFNEALAKLIPKASARRDPVRLVGVGLSQLSKDQKQANLFTAEDDIKWERTLRSVDALRAKHGQLAVQFGKSVSKE